MRKRLQPRPGDRRRREEGQGRDRGSLALLSAAKEHDSNSLLLGPYGGNRIF